MGPRRRGLLGLLGLLACTGTARAQARSDALEQQVKAAYLFNFIGFVEWPAESFAAADSPLQIGIMEADALADQLVRTIAGRTVRGRPLAVRKLRRADPTAELHLLFIGLAPKPALADALGKARRRSVLLVTDAEGALQEGSMINFVLADERLRFEVAPKTAEQSGLAISARLLAAALRVEGKMP
ncbi:MAG TPA: YfiR family protein [Pseudorhodoferax sp.]|nr:YfiR family protein [Pseudorhodoferax sp.]